MPQPVKISDELLADARAVAKSAERSIAGQIEFWAQLGRAIEPMLEGAQALRLRRSGGAVPLSQLLAEVDTPAGRQRVVRALHAQPFPHYEPAPDKPGLVYRVTEEGERTLGRFVGRRFIAVK